MAQLSLGAFSPPSHLFALTASPLCAQCEYSHCFPVPTQVLFHDVAVLTDKLFPVVEAMQKHFSAGSGTYYSDSIFFLSVAMHQIMPKGNPWKCGFTPV